VRRIITVTATPLQSAIQALIDELVAAGAETGVQVAVIERGQLVVDAVSGIADPETAAAVSSGTLFYAASTAKGVASTVAHVLVERGELGYDLRAADVWPGFGSHGKQALTLRHVLLHSAGLPALPPDTSVEDLCDWERMCAVLAAAEPWWTPGTRFGYHPMTFGFLLGEILRRATGRDISTLLREVVTRPLSVADEVFFGVPARLLGRIATQVSPGRPGPEPPAGSPLDRAMPRAIRPDAALANRADILTSDIPSAGTMTARGAARMYAALLGHVPDTPLVSARRLTEMAAITHDGIDEVMGFPTQWAFGYSPHRAGGSATRPGSTFGMVGANGSAAYADIDSGVAVAVMRNRFDPGELTTLARIDRVIARLLPSSTSEPAGGPA
jgi:CubicO group peptidase (beta-lactamase class C family)